MKELYQEKYLSDYSQKDAYWDVKKTGSQTVQRMYSTEPEFERLSLRMGMCGLSLGFSESLSHETGEIAYRLRDAKFCHVRNCSICAWRRSMRNKHRFMKALPSLLERYPTHRYLFLTLTVPNCEIVQLRDVLGEMNRAWQRLIKRKEFRLVEGWVRSTEVTYSSNVLNTHPHFHILLMVKPSYFSKGYVKQTMWLKAWQEAMRNPSITQVDIRAMKGHVAVAEVLKYAVKEADLAQSPDWLFELTRQTRNLRFIATGGVLKGILKSDFTDKELIDGDDLEDDGEASDKIALRASWRLKQMRYTARHV